MMDGIDMGAFVAPKSDQLNADDLIAGPRTVRITKVTGTGNSDQPVAVHFEGDDGKPYKPCKSMRRVMIAAWGRETVQYVGRALTIYRDPKVAFGGMEVGGVRISHMSHIERRNEIALTVTKAKRAPYRVEPLKLDPPEDTPAVMAAELIEAVIGAATEDALKEITGSKRAVNLRARLKEARPELAEQVDAAVSNALDRLAGT